MNIILSSIAKLRITLYLRRQIKKAKMKRNELKVNCKFDSRLGVPHKKSLKT